MSEVAEKRVGGRPRARWVRSRSEVDDAIDAQRDRRGNAKVVEPKFVRILIDGEPYIVQAFHESELEVKD